MKILLQQISTKQYNSLKDLFILIREPIVISQNQMAQFNTETQRHLKSFHSKVFPIIRRMPICKTIAPFMISNAALLALANINTAIDWILTGHMEHPPVNRRKRANSKRRDITSADVATGFKMYFKYLRALKFKLNKVGILLHARYQTANYIAVMG